MNIEQLNAELEAAREGLCEAQMSGDAIGEQNYADEIARLEEALFEEV